jgi:hypothetical protein
MRPGENVRFACGECRIVFDISIAPELADGSAIDEIDDWLYCCPFCGIAELRQLHDTPTVA